MVWKEFFIEFLKLVSFDLGFGFILYLIWKYVDYKYFSQLEITTLKEENKYLRQENKKINGTSTQFWNKGDKF